MGRRAGRWHSLPVGIQHRKVGDRRRLRLNKLQVASCLRRSDLSAEVSRRYALACPSNGFDRYRKAGRNVGFAKSGGRRRKSQVCVGVFRVGYRSGEAATQDSLGRSPRNCNKTGDQRCKRVTIALRNLVEWLFKEQNVWTSGLDTLSALDRRVA